MPNFHEPESHGEDIHVLSDAEFYLLIGKEVKRRLGRADRKELIEGSLQVAAAEIPSALRFAESSTAFVLRALVENWSWPQIKAGLNNPSETSDDKMPSRSLRPALALRRHGLGGSQAT